MKRAFFSTLGLLVALSPIAVEGQLYPGMPPGMADFEFVSSSPGINGDFGYKVGPYTGNFLDDGPVGNFSIYCVDFLHYASNSSGAVNVTQLSDAAGALDNTRLGSSLPVGDAFAKYARTAFYASLFEYTADFDPTEKKYAWSGIHAAIWSVSSGVSKGSGDTADLRDDLLALSDADIALIADDFGLDYDPSDWYVITRKGFEDGYGERGDGYGQEFLMRRASVPEPATILLMITGLVMLVGVSRRREIALQDL